MITTRLMKLGQWDVTLDGADPDDFDYFEHLAFTRSRVDPRQLDDAGMLAASAYTGIIRRRGHADGKLTLSGVGLEAWLGDEDDKGFVYETARVYVSGSFANVLDSTGGGGTEFGLLRDDAGAQTAIRSGTIHSVAGTYDGTHHYQTQRSAIRYVCDIFGAEYRINPDGTLDAGAESDLFVTTPTAIVVKESGEDPNLTGVVGKLSTDLDVDDYTTRVVLLGDGAGSSISIGEADNGAVPYKDLFGNTVVRTRVVNEAETSSGNAVTRAQLHASGFDAARKAIRLLADEYEIDGSFAVGDTIWVYDPEQGLTDTANEVQFRGRTLNPIAIRVLGFTYPAPPGVYHRDKDGNWTDISDLVVRQGGSSTIEVGANPRKLTSSSGAQVISGRVNSPTSADSATPAAPAHANTPWGTSSYVDGEGRTRAQIVVEWSLPLNTDGSTITDGSHYLVRWRRSGETEYQTSAVAWGTTAFLLQDLSPGVTYEISVAAFDLAGNSAGYASDESVVASQDTTAPSTPAAPTLAANPLRLQVSHDLGKASGGTFNLESDLDHLNVYASTSSGFTPAESNRIGQIPATQAHLSLGITVIGSFDVTDATARYVKVTAVDGAGNESTPSAQASASATLIDTAHITDLAVTNAKINDLAVSKLTAGTITSQGIVITGAGGYLRSGNYSAGSAGFNIDASDGSAEFNNVTVRGSLGASSVVGDLVLSGGKIYTSSSTPRVVIEDGAPSYALITFEVGGTASDPRFTAALSAGDPSIRLYSGYNAGEQQSQILLSSGTTSGITLDGDLVHVTGDAIRLPDGTEGAPSIAFSSDPDTGLYSPLADQVSIVTGGNKRILVGSSDIIFYTDGGDVLYQFDDNADTGTHIWGTNSGAQMLQLRRWTSADTDIDGLIGGSAFGTLLTGTASAHFTIGLTENDADDAFQIISGGGNWSTDSTWDTLVMEVKSGAGSASSLWLLDGLTDVGNHETLRLDRGTGTTTKAVGYYSSWAAGKEDILPLDTSPRFPGLTVIDQISPVDFQRKSTGQREWGFLLDDFKALSDDLRYLTTKGDQWGYSPDEAAISAVLWQGLKDARQRIAALEGAA